MYYLSVLRLRKLSPINEINEVYEVFVPVSSLSPHCDTGILFEFLIFINRLVFIKCKMLLF